MRKILLLTNNMKQVLECFPDCKSTNYIKHKLSPTFKCGYKNHTYTIVLSMEYLDSNFDKVFIHLSKKSDDDQKISTLVNIGLKYTHKNDILIINNTDDINYISDIHDQNLRSYNDYKHNKGLIPIIHEEFEKSINYNIRIDGTDELYEDFIESIKCGIDKFNFHDVIIFNVGHIIYNFHLHRDPNNVNYTIKLRRQPTDIRFSRNTIWNYIVSDLTYKSRLQCNKRVSNPYSTHGEYIYTTTSTGYHHLLSRLVDVLPF